MPPRYVYWTIIVDGQPTAFRSGSLEDIMPTFNRLKEKQPNAELKWFQNGQLWPSRHDAQDFMRARGERGRAKDPRQSSSAEERPWSAKPEWKTRSTFSSKSDKPRVNRDAPAGERPAWVPKGPATKRDVASGFSGSPGEKPEGRPAWKPKGAGASVDRPARRATSWGEGEDRPSFGKPTEGKPAGQALSVRKPEWKPKGTFKPREAGHASGWGEKPSFAKPTEGRPAWKGQGDASGKPEWKPKGTFRPAEEGHRPSARDQARSSFRPKSFTPKVDDGRTRSSRVQSRNDKLEWQPKGSAPRPDGPNSGFARTKDGEGADPPEGKRKWVPKADYKKSLGIEAKRDDKWRPGGEHKDPKQKYKDAKKAKWTKFKANIRARSTKPRRPKDE